MKLDCLFSKQLFTSSLYNIDYTFHSDLHLYAVIPTDG